jgi:molybdopterin-guanine dinucleotide biosynthesis protein A
MPDVKPDFLGLLLDDAASRNVDCLIPRSPDGQPEPLCAVYHRRCLPTIREALAARRLKVIDALAPLQVVWREGDPAGLFRNANTPEEWQQVSNA